MRSTRVLDTVSSSVVRFNEDRLSANNAREDPPVTSSVSTAVRFSLEVELGGRNPAMPFQCSMFDKRSRLMRRRRLGSLRRY